VTPWSAAEFKARNWRAGEDEDAGVVLEVEFLEGGGHSDPYQPMALAPLPQIELQLHAGRFAGYAPELQAGPVSVTTLSKETGLPGSVFRPLENSPSWAPVPAIAAESSMRSPGRCPCARWK